MTFFLPHILLFWPKVLSIFINLYSFHIDSFKTDGAITGNKLQVNSQVIKEKELEVSYL